MWVLEAGADDNLLIGSANTASSASLFLVVVVVVGVHPTLRLRRIHCLRLLWLRLRLLLWRRLSFSWPKFNNSRFLCTAAAAHSFARPLARSLVRRAALPWPLLCTVVCQRCGSGCGGGSCSPSSTQTHTATLRSITTFLHCCTSARPLAPQPQPATHPHSLYTFPSFLAPSQCTCCCLAYASATQAHAQPATQAPIGARTKARCLCAIQVPNQESNPVAQTHLLKSPQTHTHCREAD